MAAASAELTVAMCFLNERDEVRSTVSSVRATAGDHVQVLLVNDASAPDYDYRAVAREFDCRYIENDTRRGPARCRSLIADVVETPTVLLVDAHMRFYDDRWWQTIAGAVAANPRALYCVRSLPLQPDGEPTGGPAGVGASVVLTPDEPEPARVAAHSILEPTWNTRRRGAGPVETVPVVLGGAYAFDRGFFQDIGGLLGLAMYGGDEAYLSAKAWLAGGGCFALTDVAIGHIYRTAETLAPFANPTDFFVYNKMVLLATVFPESRFEAYRRWMRRAAVYEAAVSIFRRNQAFLRRLRDHFHSRVFRRPFGFFEELNTAFRAGADISRWATG